MCNMMGMLRYIFLSLFFCNSICSECPFNPACNCTRIQKLPNHIIVTCSDTNLHHLPYMNSDSSMVERFYGQNNDITEIPNNIFIDAMHLKDLDLSNNNISVIYNESFNGLVRLENLNLEHNKLDYTLENMPLTCFQHVTQLRSLNLKNNAGPYPTGKYYPNLSPLTKLETLKLDGVSGDNFASRFLTLTSLSTLDLSSKECNIGVIKTEYFLSFPYLRNIDISNCKLKRIWKNTFSHLKYLTYLNVSFNEDLTFLGVANITHDLQFTSIEVFKAEKVHKTFEMNTKIRYETLKYLQKTKLRELYLDSNRIQEIQTGVASILPKTVSVLSMTDNMFSFGIYILELKNTNISFLNVSYQFTSHYIHNVLQLLPQFEENRDHQSLNVIPQFANNRHQHSLEVTPQFAKNQHQQSNEVIPKATKNRYRRSLGINFPIPFPKNLKEIHYRNCKLQLDIPRIQILENNLEYLDISGNLFGNWQGPLVNFLNLKYLNMSSNYAVNISKYFFTGTPNLEKLYIQNNLLGFSIPFDKHGMILKPVQKLIEIDLSQNRIPEFSPSFFRFQSNLERIYLQENFLEDINFEITHMKNLSYVDVSGNRIQYLGEDAISQLETMAHNHVIQLDLSKNPFGCRCKSLKFLNWMSTTNIHLVNLDEYQCKYDNGTKVQMSDIRNLYNNLNKACSSFPGIVIGITSGIVLFLSVTVVGVVFRYRWKLRYLYYMTKNRFRGYVPVMQESDRVYLYDAFISYAEQDSKFVHNDMIKNLEKEGNLKLCLHRRDFIAGKEIAANITSAIHNSRKTVVILSQYFLESNWCMFEFNMARMESMYTRENDNVLYLVFLSSIPPRNLPLIMMEYVNSNTYIEYPNDEYGNVVFWQKMRETLHV